MPPSITVVMKKKTINTKSRRVEKLAEEAQDLLSEGHEVVLTLSSNAKPDRIINIMNATIGDYKAKVEIKGIKLKENLELATVGAAVGAGAFGIALVCATAAAGAAVTTITWPVALTAMGIGAVVGFAVGAGVSVFYEVKVYKHQGETRMKFTPVPA